ncbi:MAG TPA: FG-GAP-like repeat-containing protein [Candidatus Dormibacteraeota bacterium]|nr:FG-GAP-like repeat-containing protein [Candidatus Dormibacteraeota bacterium]
MPVNRLMTSSSTHRPASLLLALLLFVLPAPSQGPSGPPSEPVTVRWDAKRAQKAAERGDKAVSAGRVDEALAEYQEAARYAPQDADIVGRGAALRSKLIRVHVDAAERNALEGHLQQATEELHAALRIDPQNAIVTERLAQMKDLEDEKSAAQPNGEITGIPKLRPQPGKYNLDMRGDTRSVYEQLAELFGVKASFDPDLISRPVRLRANDMDFYTAASLLGTQTATFWRPLNPTLFFVAADTPEKRKEYGLQAQQVFPLSAAVGSEEMTELLRLLRDITGATHIEMDSGSRSITLRDTPEKLALAGKLIKEVEQARGEVMLQAELLEVDRNALRKLGITPPSSTSLIYLSPNNVKTLLASKDLPNLLTNAQQIFSGKGFSSIPPFVIVGGGLSTFLLTLPGTAVDFSDSLSLVRSGRQILLRAQDGKPATFFVGDRFPVTLSLLSGSLGGVPTFAGVPSSANFPETSFPVGNKPAALAANKLTGGTLPDLAVANLNDNTITILQNGDKGDFFQPKTSPILLGKNETGPAALATGIFRNTNPDPAALGPAPADLVTANSTSNTVSVLLGKGDGTFTEAPGSPFAVGKQPSAVVVADFNGDGKLDFAVANKGDNSISIFRGKGDGTFAQFPSSPIALSNTTNVSEKGPVAMVAADFRNKGRSDLAVVNQTSNNVSVLLGSVDQNLNVTFLEAPQSPIKVGTSPVAIATGDLDADGTPDLAVVNQGDNTVSILLASPNASGTFVPANGSPLPTASSPAGIAIANFANSAVPDIAVTNQGQNTLGVYLGAGGGTYAPRIELNTPASPGAMITAILTTSGLPDVAFTGQGTTANQGIVTVVQDTPSFATGRLASAAQQPYPGAEFIDLGVKVKATPSLHSNDEVTLQLEFEIRSLAGVRINGIPVISNRTITQTVRVKEGQPTLLGGLTDREETRAITGLPGFADLPGGIGYAFGGHRDSLQDTELMILITPKRLRVRDLNTRTIFAGHGERGTTPSDLPSDRAQPRP